MSRAATISIILLVLTTIAGPTRAELLLVGSEHVLSAYDLDNDSVTAVWSDAFAGLVDVAYDPQLDDGYYFHYQSSGIRHRFYRDNEPAQFYGNYSSTDTDLVKDYYGGISLDRTFGALSVNSGATRMVFESRNPNSYSTI